MSPAEAPAASALNLFPRGVTRLLIKTAPRGDSHFCILRACDNLIVFLPEELLRYLDRLQPLALFFVRLTLGAIMVSHGYHKVFGGLHHHAQFVASLGLPVWAAYLS